MVVSYYGSGAAPSAPLLVRPVDSGLDALLCIVYGQPHVLVYVSMYQCKYVCMYVCMYACMFVCRYFRSLSLYWAPCNGAVMRFFGRYNLIAYAAILSSPCSHKCDE